MNRRHAMQIAALSLALCGASAPALAAPETEVALFKVVTVKDEIVIGLTADQIGGIGSRDAAAVARSVTDRGSLEVWRYTVAKGATGDLINVPLARIGLMPAGLVRIEPYTTSLAIVPPAPGAR